MRSSSVCLVLILAALLACKKKESTSTQPASTTPTVTPEPTPPPVEEKIEDFRGSYVTNWGKAKCTQVKRNVNCLYAGKSGSMDCKVVGERELDCEWDEPGASGRSKLTKKEDGKLAGTWGNGSSATNGGAWVFKPVAE